MARTVRVEGLRELEKALGELPKATGKAVLRRVLKKRAEPVAGDFRSKVRVDEGDLRDSVGVSTKLTRRQASQHRRMGDRATVEMFIGAGGLTQAITEEFGTVDQAPHPGLRPAWDSGKFRVLAGLKDDIWAEIKKSADRLAKRLAKRRG